MESPVRELIAELKFEFEANENKISFLQGKQEAIEHTLKQLEKFIESFEGTKSC